MSLTCKILTSFLLIFTVSTKGKLVRGSPLSPLEASLATLKWVQESERSQPSFPRQWATSVTFLLLVGEVSENTEVIWGCLDHDINLDIPGFQMNDRVADTRWDKNKIKIAQLKQHKPPYQITDTYVMLKNGTLKIKALKRNDSDVYTVSVYDLNGKNILEKAFALKVQGKSLSPKFLHLSMGAI